MRRNIKAILIIISIIVLLLLIMLAVYMQNRLWHIWAIDSNESQIEQMVIGSSQSMAHQNEFSGANVEAISQNDEETSIQFSDSGEDIHNSENSHNSANSVIEFNPEQSMWSSAPMVESEIVEESSVYSDSELINDSVVSEDSELIEDSNLQEESSESLPIIEGENKENELPLVPIG